MSAWAIIQISMALLKVVLDAAKVKGATDTINLVSAAIESLQKVRGTPVTKAQVESLTIKHLW